jgi:cbb3-type cytochrome oxidase subunit 3
VTRVRKRRNNSKISNNGKRKKTSFSVFLVLILMCFFLVLFFVFRGRISEVFNFDNAYDLVNQDKNLHQKNEPEQKIKNIAHSDNPAGDNEVLKSPNESAEPEYKEEDKNYLNKIIKGK